MAVAGKVAITPKGEWNAQTDYTKLDLVFYDNASYVAIKPSTGVIPTDESCWMLVVQSAGGADFEGIINGDIQVGNAKSLDGHEAEYFAKAESVAEINLGEINILESELDTLVKDYEISNGVTYTASIRLKTSSDGKYIFGGINFGLIGMEYGNNTQGFQLGISGSLIKMRRLNSGTWGEWKTLATLADLAKYLPLTGGQVKGTFSVRSDTASAIWTDINNTLRRVYQTIYSDGGYALVDGTNGKNIILSMLDGENNTFYGHSSKDLPLTGGTQSIISRKTNTPLAINNDADGATTAYLAYQINGAMLGRYGFSGVDKPVFKTASGTDRDLLHTGNGATYEEGTFDLTLEGRTLSGYKYTKIGNFVYLSGLVPFNGEPLTIENTTVEVHGLPFGISSVPPYLYFGTAIYSPSNKATDNLVNYVPGGTYFGIGSGGTTSFAVGTPCILHAMYITD